MSSYISSLRAREQLPYCTLLKMVSTSFTLAPGCRTWLRPPHMHACMCHACSARRKGGWRTDTSRLCCVRRPTPTSTGVVGTSAWLISIEMKFLKKVSAHCSWQLVASADTSGRQCCSPLSSLLYGPNSSTIPLSASAPELASLRVLVAVSLARPQL